MAPAAPFVPGLPGLVPARKGRRRCAAHLGHGWTLTPLLQPEPSPILWDFLTLWYTQVRQEQEHASLWGEVGLSPSRFVLAFTSVPLILLHHDACPWNHPEGLCMGVWLDDVVPGVRARCHQWVAPAYRHPRVSVVLGQRMLRYLFEEMGFQMLEGRTPINNRLALRYARRLGFRRVAILPYGEWAWALDGTKTLTPVVQSQLTVDEWRAAHNEPYVDHERAAEDARAWVPA